MASLTKEQLLNPKRTVHQVQLAEFDAPLLLGTPSGLLSLRLREMQARGVPLESEESLLVMAVDMVVDEGGAPLLSREEAPRFLERLSLESLTALLVKFTELVVPAKGAEPGNSKPSTSAA
jgi:hypothetical protein